MLVFICDLFSPFLLLVPGPLTELQQCRYLAQCRYLPPVQPPSEPTKKYKLCDKQLAELIEVSRSIQNQNTVHEWIVYSLDPIWGIKGPSVNVKCSIQSLKEKYVLRF